jgi:hypothetical protein
MLMAYSNVAKLQFAGSDAVFQDCLEYMRMAPGPRKLPLYNTRMDLVLLLDHFLKPIFC